MDSPLNWAHLQERKAESFLNCHQFSEAIQCHQRAAEYLIEAMKLTHVTQDIISNPKAEQKVSFLKALASIQLQYEANLRQEKILKDKWRRYELQQKRIRLEKERLKRELQEKHSQNHTKKVDTIDGQKKCEHMDTSTCSLVISAENFSVSSLSSSTEFLTSKDEKDELNDLRSQVRDLQIQQLSLTQALEDSNRENTKLKKTIATLKNILKSKLDMDFDENLFVVEKDVEQAAHINVNYSQVFSDTVSKLNENTKAY